MVKASPSVTPWVSQVFWSVLAPLKSTPMIFTEAGFDTDFHSDESLSLWTRGIGDFSCNWWTGVV
jgi:hypothetical protein